MKIKTSIISALLFLLSFAPSCLAHSMPENDMAIGGIGFGSSLREVASALGAPDEVQRINEGILHIVVYVYKSGFSASGRFVDEDTPESAIKVAGVTVTGSAYATPSGITVGMPLKTVIDRYGEGKRIDYGQGIVLFSYANPTGTREICFYVDSSNRITKISTATEI